MAYRLYREETLESGLRRIVTEQLSKAICELQDDSLDRFASVHQVRKRFKKIRGLLRLVRFGLGETYNHANRNYRDAGRRLSRVRDAESMIETLQRISRRYRKPLQSNAFADVQQWLEARRKKIADDWIDLDVELAELHEALEITKREVSDWSLAGCEKRIAFAGVKKTYRRGCEARNQAIQHATDGDLHEWRKRMKYHWYHLRLLRDIWEPVMQARIGVLHELSDLLGKDHDLAVFTQILHNDSQICRTKRTVELLLGLIKHRRGQLQTAAFRLGDRVCAEKPKVLRNRLKTYWDAWKN